MTVLNVIELTKQSMIPFYIAAVCVTVSIISLLIAINTSREWLTMPGAASAIIFFLIAIGLLIFASDFQEPTGKYQYEIMIDDSTTFSEVIEKYDIIEQRGEIFVVEEKE